MSLKVGDKRSWIGGSFGRGVFEIKAMYLTQAIIEENKTIVPCAVSEILNLSIPYQEPKPVRKLKAFEHGNGTIVFRYCDKTNDLDYSSNYRKLSDSELKELIKGVIGE